MYAIVSINFSIKMLGSQALWPRTPLRVGRTVRLDMNLLTGSSGSISHPAPLRNRGFKKNYNRRHDVLIPSGGPRSVAATSEPASVCAVRLWCGTKKSLNREGGAPRTPHGRGRACRGPIVRSRQARPLPLDAASEMRNEKTP